MQDILEESWICKGMVQECWIEDYEGFWKWSRYQSLWILENWRLDKTYREPEGSWAWEELMQQAWAKGYQQGYQIGIVQGVAIRIVAAKFVDLETLAKVTITPIDDLERLRQLIVDLDTYHTREHVARVLLSLDA